MELPGTDLDTVVDLADGRRGALSAHQVVAPGLEHRKRVLHVAALGETGAEEGRVDGEQDPRAALEDDGAQQDADPEEDFEASDNRHGSIVVLLDKGSDGIRHGVLGVYGLAGGRGAARGGFGLGGNDKGRNDVGAGVRRNVEDRVDAIGKHRKGILGEDEPNNGHHWRVSAGLWQPEERLREYVLRYWMFSSARYPIGLGCLAPVFWRARHVL